MTAQRLVVALTALNIALVASTFLSRTRPAVAASEVASVLRGRALEIVDDRTATPRLGSICGVSRMAKRTNIGIRRRSEALHRGDHHDDLPSCLYRLAGQGGSTVAFLTTELQLVEGKQLDASKTALAVIGLGAVVGLVVALSNIQTTDPNH